MYLNVNQLNAGLFSSMGTKDFYWAIYLLLSMGVLSYHSKGLTLAHSKDEQSAY